MHPGHPSPMLSFASHQHTANARFGLWDAWQAVLSALTWPNVEMRFEFHAERPDFTNTKRTMALTIVKAKKQKKGVLHKTRTPAATGPQLHRPSDTTEENRLELRSERR